MLNLPEDINWYLTDFVLSCFVLFLKYDITAFWRELLKDTFSFSQFFESCKMNLKSREWGCIALVLISFKLSVCNIKILSVYKLNKDIPGDPSKYLSALLLWSYFQIWVYSFLAQFIKNVTSQCACTHLCF